MSLPARPRMLLVGGGGGLVGRALLHEFLPDHAIRTFHRHRSPEEAAAGIEWLPGDLAGPYDPGPLLRDVNVVVGLAWYRQPKSGSFARLTGGFLRLLTAARDAGVQRWIHVSVPPGPADLEETLPYFREKRAVESALVASGLPYLIVRPTMLFAPRDKLLTVLLRLARRYRVLPMFGEGRYHVSPLAAADLARIVRLELRRSGPRDLLVGGPHRYEYRELTDAVFSAIGRAPRYWRMSAAGGVRLARMLEAVGSTLLYAYEVRWLTADLLGLPPYTGLDPPMGSVESFLAEQAAGPDRWARGRGV